MTLVLTEEGFKNLPCLRPNANVKMIGIHHHRGLSGGPFTIETGEGHFRVPRVLIPLVKRAFQSLEHYDGPEEGAVNEVLRRIAECRVGGDGDLAAIVGGIVDEAVAELRSRVVEAARARSDDRAGLVAEAMRAMAGA